MSYRHDQSVMCVVGICDACDRRWLAGDVNESRRLARVHELSAHPGEHLARDALHSAATRARRAGLAT